jgi:hypothetical protein
MDEYDFLNLGLPGGSSPMSPQISPPANIFSPDFIDDYAGFQLPDVDLVSPPPQQLDSGQISDFLLGVRPFERGLSTTDLVTPDQEQTRIDANLRRVQNENAVLQQTYQNEVAARVAELEAIQNAKTALQAELNTARADQDVIRQEAVSSQLAALAEQEQAFTAQIDQLTANYESQIAGLEDQLGSQAQDFSGQIASLDQEIANLSSARDQALAEQDVIRAEAVESERQALAAQRAQFEANAAQQQAEIDRLLGRESSLVSSVDQFTEQRAQMASELAANQQRIADLQAQLDAFRQASPSDAPADQLLDQDMPEPSLEEDQDFPEPVDPVELPFESVEQILVPPAETLPEEPPRIDLPFESVERLPLPADLVQPAKEVPAFGRQNQILGLGSYQRQLPRGFR